MIVVKRSPYSSREPEDSQPEVVDFSQANEAERVLPSGPLVASQPGALEGLHLGFYRHPPYGLPETVSPQHLILIHLEGATAVEQRLGAQTETQFFQTGSVLVVPAHMPHRATWEQENSYLLLSLEPNALRSRYQAMGVKQDVALLPRFSPADPLVHGIGLSLKAELESGSPGRSLYVDSLYTALLAHLSRHYSTQSTQDSGMHSGIQTVRSASQSEGLPPYLLNQVLDYIDTALHRTLTLAELAAIAHLSSNHFTRLFKQSTGLPPHQYVIQQRVERAKQLLLMDRFTLAEVALEVGFAHQSHLTRHFKRWVGTTPKAFLKHR